MDRKNRLTQNSAQYENELFYSIKIDIYTFICIDETPCLTLLNISAGLAIFTLLSIIKEFEIKTT